jgi:hypothetical protein
VSRGFLCTAKGVSFAVHAAANISSIQHNTRHGPCCMGCVVEGLCLQGTCSTAVKANQLGSLQCEPNACLRCSMQH